MTLRDITDWLCKDIPAQTQPLPSRGTLLRWEQERKDRESGEYRFNPANPSSSEARQRKRFRELCLLELEADAADMIAAGNDGWPDSFVAPSGLKTAVVKALLSAGGSNPLKEKLQTINEVRGGGNGLHSR